MENNNLKSMIRLRMSSGDAHYGGNLVDGARTVSYTHLDVYKRQYLLYLSGWR